MIPSRRQKTIASALAVLSVVFVIMGAVKHYAISPDRIKKPPSPAPVMPDLNAPPFGMPPIPKPPKPTEAAKPGKAIPTEISDLGLVVNATFTGILNDGGQLYWTYNPTEKRGKRACPT